MKTKENQRIALTKRLLKESLLRLMPEKSIQRITVSELCEASEINRSTFYNHYGCPADVLKEIETDVIADLERIWDTEGAEKNWPMNRRVEALCAYLLEHRQVAMLLLRDSDTNSEFATLLSQAAHVRAIYEQLLSHVENPDSKQLMTTFLTTGTYHMIRQWLLEDIPKTPKEMGDLVYLVATQGWERSAAPKVQKQN
ncbi:MAG: TetR/AcrR family transcriptional regulator [Oscillospiraceae bacterium]